MESSSQYLRPAGSPSSASHSPGVDCVIWQKSMHVGAQTQEVEGSSQDSFPNSWSIVDNGSVLQRPFGNPSSLQRLSHDFSHPEIIMINEINNKIGRNLFFILRYFLYLCYINLPFSKVIKLLLFNFSYGK